MTMKYYILLIFFITPFLSIAQKPGYFVFFGGDYKTESFTIKNEKVKYLKNINVSINESTSISKDFLFFDSSFFDSQLNIRIKKNKRQIAIPLKKEITFKYVYIWYYKNKMTYEILNTPLKLE